MISPNPYQCIQLLFLFLVYDFAKSISVNMMAKQSSCPYPMFPDPHPMRLRAGAPTPTIVVGRGVPPIQSAPLSSSLASHAPLGRAYSTADPNILRMNGRPYWVHGLLGKGGYGEVFTVEMLLPAGLEVAFSENGDIKIDAEDGCMLLKPKKSVCEPQETGRLPPAEVVDLSSSTFPYPPSTWSSFGDASLAEEFRTTEHDDREEPSRQDHGQATSSSVPTTTSLQRPEGSRSPTDHFVYSSGVFLALKMQCARSAEELALLVKEVENLRFLKDDQGVVQIIDHAVNDKFLKLAILMELGVASFYGGDSFTKLWAFFLPYVS